MTLRTVVAGILLSFSAITPSLAQAAIKHPIDIRQQQLASALTELARQTHIQVVYTSDLVEGLRTPALSGTMTPEEALGQLLSNTGLRYEFVDSQTVTLSREGGSNTPPKTPASAPSPAASTDRAAEEPQKKSFWDRFRLAQVDSGSSVSGVEARDASSGTNQPIRLEEVTVTAQKRQERLQDVPLPVTAVNADSLLESNQIRLQDYSTRVPALSVTPGYTGAPTLAIRGITTGSGGGNPTVAVVVDDVAFGSSTHLGGGSAVPDFDPSDLSRIEVLRGPQGTLYGASSVGGLIKFVTVDPSTDRVSGRVQGGLSGVKNGAEMGYNIRGSVNVPVTESFAIRASAFTRRDPGYIDDPTLGIDGVNKTDVQGARLSSLWQVSDAVSLKVSALYQNMQADGSSLVYAQPGLGDLEQSAPRGSGAYTGEMQAYSAILEAQLGTGELTSLTGYNVNRIDASLDFTPIFGPLTENGLGGFPGFGTPGTSIVDRNRAKKFTQELRYTFATGAQLDWLLGAFYTDEDAPYSESILALDVPTGNVVGSWLYTPYPTTYKEWAAFADLTVHVTDRFDVQFGARESENRQTYSSAYVGPYAPVFLGQPSPFIPASGRTTANAFTYLVTPTLKVAPELMVYARLASGYRPGGPNTNSTLNPVPDYAPDRTLNYELGLKGSTLEHRLSFDASVYYIDWQDIQLQVLDPNLGVSTYINGSRARSQGIELSIEARPFASMVLGAWAAFNEAELTEDFPPTGTNNAVGLSGDRLPNSPRFSGAVTIEQEFALAGELTGFIGGSVSYVGDRKDVFASIFAATPARQDLPAYARTDLRGGLKRDTWSLNVFVTNLTDRRGLVTGGLGSTNPIAYTYIQPRTGGISFTKTF